MTRNKTSRQTGSFHDLKKVIEEAGVQLRSEELAPPRISSQSPREDRREEESDEEAFDHAMQDVQRAAWKHSRISPTEVPVRAPAAAPEDERLMREAIEGELAALAHEHPEYIEGWVNVVGKRYLPNLRNGMYSIQEQLDLHGFNRIEARTAVEEFITRMSRFRSCCVKVIHGRGINSPTDRAVLKDSLQRWLSTRRMSRYVVAYASAPVTDGGVGAVYVLLRHATRNPAPGRQ